MSVEGSAPAVFIHNLCDQFWAGLLFLLLSFFLLFFFFLLLSLGEQCPVFVFATKPTWWGNLTPRSITTRLSCFSAAFQKASRAVQHPFQFLEWKVSVHARRQAGPVSFRGGGNICIVVARTKDREGQKLSGPIQHIIRTIT